MLWPMAMSAFFLPIRFTKGLYCAAERSLSDDWLPTLPAPTPPGGSDSLWSSCRSSLPRISVVPRTYARPREHSGFHKTPIVLWVARPALLPVPLSTSDHKCRDIGTFCLIFTCKIPANWPYGRRRLFCMGACAQWRGHYPKVHTRIE